MKIVTPKFMVMLWGGGDGFVFCLLTNIVKGGIISSLMSYAFGFVVSYTSFRFSWRKDK